jgi:hypothetical protein
MEQRRFGSSPAIRPSLKSPRTSGKRRFVKILETRNVRVRSFAAGPVGPAIRRVRPSTATCHKPTVHRADAEGRQRVELTSSTSRRRMGRCLRPPDGRSRREADVANWALGRLNWAESDRRPNGGNRRHSRRASPRLQAQDRSEHAFLRASANWRRKAFRSPGRAGSGRRCGRRYAAAPESGPGIFAGHEGVIPRSVEQLMARAGAMGSLAARRDGRGSLEGDP